MANLPQSTNQEDALLSRLGGVIRPYLVGTRISAIEEAINAAFTNKTLKQDGGRVDFNSGLLPPHDPDARDLIVAYFAGRGYSVVSFDAKQIPYLPVSADGKHGLQLVAKVMKRHDSDQQSD